MVAWNVIKNCQFSVRSIERCKHNIAVLLSDLKQHML